MSNFDVARRGISLLVEEIRRRGGAAVPSDAIYKRNGLTLRTGDGVARSLYVKTRRRGDWQTDTRREQPREPEANDMSFWVFVDLSAEQAAFYIAPAWWVENDIYENHNEYLARHGGQRAQNPLATHHRVQPRRVEQWEDRWDLLGLS